MAWEAWEQWKEGNAAELLGMQLIQTEVLRKMRMDEILDKLRQMDSDLSRIGRKVSELERRIDTVEEMLGEMKCP